MTGRKTDNLLRGDRTPAYVDRETGAAELLISTDTWDQWVKDGRLGQRTLARKRESGVTLPEGVEKTKVRKRNGKVYTYYYWNPGRGTDRERERIKLPNAATEPKAFWAEVERRQSSAPTGAGSIGDLISRYRGSDEFTRLSEGTQSNYEVTMRRFEAHDTWGMVSVRDLTPLAV